MGLAGGSQKMVCLPWMGRVVRHHPSQRSAGAARCKVSPSSCSNSAGRKHAGRGFGSWVHHAAIFAAQRYRRLSARRAVLRWAGVGGLDRVHRVSLFHPFPARRSRVPFGVVWCIKLSPSFLVELDTLDTLNARKPAPVLDSWQGIPPAKVMPWIPWVYPVNHPGGCGSGGRSSRSWSTDRWQGQ
jgi:hypothetical protein